MPAYYTEGAYHENTAGVPIPLIDTLLKRVAVDWIGPIKPISDKGNSYVLTVVDYATRYPEAVPLRYITTEEVAEAFYC